jgi:hypothetical protein
MRQHHVQMALVHRHIGRFADRPAGMVEVGRGLREFDEVLEVLDGAKTATAVEVHDEGAAVGRGEDNVLAADLHRVGRIAGVLGELGRGGFQDFA